MNDLLYIIYTPHILKSKSLQFITSLISFIKSWNRTFISFSTFVANLENCWTNISYDVIEMDDAIKSKINQDQLIKTNTLKSKEFNILKKNYLNFNLLIPIQKSVNMFWYNLMKYFSHWESCVGMVGNIEDWGRITGAWVEVTEGGWVVPGTRHHPASILTSQPHLPCWTTTNVSSYDFS